MAQRIYYSVSSRRYGGGGHELLAAVRKAYFEKGQAAHGVFTAGGFGADATARYRIGRKGLKWELTDRRGHILERARALPGGYEILCWNSAGALLEKSEFSAGHQWLQSSYYLGGAEPVMRLVPKGQTLLCTENSPQGPRSTILYPCAPEGENRALLDSLAGAAQIQAQTSEGSFFYLDAHALAARRQAAQALAQGKHAKGPAWDPVPTPAQIPFQFVADAPHATAPANSQPAPAQANAAFPATAPVAPPQSVLQANSQPLPTRADAVSPATAPVVAPETAAAQPLCFDLSLVRAAALQGGTAPCTAPDAEAAGLPAQAARPAKCIVVSETERYLYYGGLHAGLREGQGRTAMGNGHTAYEGGYHADQREGFGTYYYQSGQLCYAGQWHEGRREGTGVSFSAQDGSLFVGAWRNNRPHGNGACFDSAGALLYYGQWQQGMREGQGTAYADGKILYQGSWRQGRYSGEGCLYLPDGSTLRGQFAQGQAQGLCEQRDATGQLLCAGMWKQGQLVSGVRYQQGKPVQVVPHMQV